jgi:hypothetical protein
MYNKKRLQELAGIKEVKRLGSIENFTVEHNDQGYMDIVGLDTFIWEKRGSDTVEIDPSQANYFYTKYDGENEDEDYYPVEETEQECKLLLPIFKNMFPSSTIEEDGYGCSFISIPWDEFKQKFPADYNKDWPKYIGNNIFKKDNDTLQFKYLGTRSGIGGEYPEYNLFWNGVQKNKKPWSDYSKSEDLGHMEGNEWINRLFNIFQSGGDINF